MFRVLRKSESDESDFCGVNGEVAERGCCLPGAAREVGDLHWRAVVPNGFLAQFAQATPAGEIIDVLVEREPVLQAVGQTQDHEEVHAVMVAYLSRHLAVLLPERMHELLTDGVGLLFGKESVGTDTRLLFEGETEGVVGEDAFRAGDGVDAAVGTGCAHIVLDHDGASVLRLDEHRVHVAHFDLELGLPAVGRERRLRILLEVEGIRFERNEIVEAVAAVDVHVPADRSEAMGRVLVPFVGGVVAQPPEVPVGVAAGRFVPSRRRFVPVPVVVRPQVVDVGAFGVDELAELAETAEIEREHLHLAVAAVLELHAVAAKPFGGLDELPAFLDRERGGNLSRDMLAGVHRVERDWHMQFPWRGVVDEIHIRVVTETLPFLGAARIHLRRGTSRLCG